MKIALVCTSNILYMPFVENYLKVLDDNYLNYDVILWDRFNVEDVGDYIYKDFKVGHKRSFVDYYRFANFILRILKNYDYDKVITFDIQPLFFIGNYLIKNYKNKFIVDIRDYHKIIHCFNFKNIVENSEFVVVSSPGYLKWLPKSDKYVISHNVNIEKMNLLKETREKLTFNNKILIGCLGALRDYKINIDLINSLKNSKDIILYYYGEGSINDDISKYTINNKIENVNIAGRYERNEEYNLYCKNDMINVLRYNDGINNYTALPNRLYHSTLYARPMLAFCGTYLANIIENYNLGLVINSFENLEGKILRYIDKLDSELYLNGRNMFMKAIDEDNNFYKLKLEEFMRSIIH